jgi:hypothetical protein
MNELSNRVYRDHGAATTYTMLALLELEHSNVEDAKRILRRAHDQLRETSDLIAERARNWGADLSGEQGSEAAEPETVSNAAR